MLARGTDNGLQVNTVEFNGTAHGWQGIGGTLDGSPTAIVLPSPPVTLEVYVRGSDKGLHLNRLVNGSWSGYSGLGGQLS